MSVPVSAIRVARPASLAEALSLLAEKPAARPVAGGTDAMVRMKEGHWVPPLWVDIRRLPELRGIRADGGRLTVGAGEPYGSLLRSPLLQARGPLLLQAVRDVGSVQIRATGTIGGNLGTASPAGDAIPPLYALGAVVHLASRQGERAVEIEQFFLGPGRTVRRPDELITAVSFPPQDPAELSLWQKLGLRGAQAISVVSLALRLTPGPDPGTVQQARFAYGSVGPTVLRARKAETLAEQVGTLTHERRRAVARMAWKEVLPISDIRASAEYRREMAVALLERGLHRVLGTV